MLILTKFLLPAGSYTWVLILLWKIIVGRMSASSCSQLYPYDVKTEIYFSFKVIILVFLDHTIFGERPAVYRNCKVCVLHHCLDYSLHFRKRT